ncbi:hypothetical protein TRIUR3_11807 [Triticum urartu]|uniref:Uncharacterized protein n=1 Tax=Triticum urartu TaxID=4572 RepID=M8A1X3_TRIUA|nr:hypothetical protein TRIUR3_11807 [Triticum urartu]
MGFVSFIGRMLFASVFLLPAYQEYALLPPLSPPDLVRAPDLPPPGTDAPLYGGARPLAPGRRCDARGLVCAGECGEIRPGGASVCPVAVDLAGVG